MADAALGSRMSSRRRRILGVRVCLSGHPRDHRGSYFATDNVLRNDSLGEIRENWHTLVKKPIETRAAPIRSAFS
jgi:hypothetical protein